jgi:hypothetical protein
MKKIKYITFVLLIYVMSSCNNLNVPPTNIIQDQTVFGNEAGITAYFARMYSELPIEDFRYSPTGPGAGGTRQMFNNFWLVNNPACYTGEGISRDVGGASTELLGYYDDGYALVRDANYFLQTLPKYVGNFSQDQINQWTGEAYFIRAFTYFAMVKRYGGIPIVKTVLNYPEQSMSELSLPRDPEEKVYDFIGADLDSAYQRMDATSPVGRANKYVAAAFKSRVMLYAGSIAKYSTVTLFDNNKNAILGIPADKANTYFQESYDAAVLLDGKYSLYMKDWKANDEASQIQNYVDLFFDASSPENIFVKEYQYPNSVHGYDAYNVPRQLMGGNGYSSEISPTLNYIQLFDGLPKNADGTLKTLDANGHYILYNTPMDLFANAEPRLRATVLVPGETFKGQVIDIRLGIYTGDASNGISELLPANYTGNYPSTVVTSPTATQTPYKLPDGTFMNPAGLSGIFINDATCAISGFSIRKYLNPDMATADVLENHSDQTWIAIRYAEVLLNRAEAAYELGGAANVQDAFNCINQIRNRAGATLLPNVSALNDITIIRNERRKELGFENKTWWDLIRWRLFDKEQNNTTYNILCPIYSAQAGKYFFDSRTDMINRRYTFNPKWYYEAIPSGDISTDPNLIQNPGY